MNNYKPLPSQEYLKECFDYNEETGELKWKTRPREHFVNDYAFKVWNKRYPNTIAGNKSVKGSQILISGTKFQLHRLIWKIYYGIDPCGEIDHINVNRFDNSIINLRLCNRTENMYNRKLLINNNSGFKGVSCFGNKWRARIWVNNKEIHLGLFDTPEEAYEAYCKAAEEYHQEFKNLG